MAKLFIAGLGIDVESPFSIRYVNIGDQQRTACGILYGYSNGKVIEGNGTIHCLTQDIACSLDMLLNGSGESYRFDGSDSGSQGTPFDNSNMTVLTRTDQFGNTVLVSNLSGSALDLSAPAGMFSDPDCEWTVIMRRYNTALQDIITTVITGMGDTILTSFIDGVPAGIPPLGIIGIDGTSNELTLQAGVVYHSISFHKGVQVDPSIAQELSGILQESYDDYAGLPFVTMSGEDLFKQPFKAKVNVDTVEMFPACAGSGGSQMYSTITFSFRQVVPRTTI